MRQKLRTAVAIGATAAATIAAAGSAQAAESLYVQQAGGGTLTARRLVLTDVAPRTTVFADRPQRTTGTTATRRFVAGWDKSFGDDPPNAALEIHDAPAGRDVAVVELRSARYDARRRTLTFAIRPLGSEATRRSAALRHFGRRADGRRVTAFDRASLFIDPGVAYSPMMVAIRVPAGGTVSFQLGNSTIDYSSNNGSFVSNLNTPAFQPDSNNPYRWTTSTGAGSFNATSISFNASSGSGGMGIDLFVGVAPPSGGATNLTGTANVAGGGSLTLNFVGEQPNQIADGAFSLPYEGL